jgi:cis-3-alkyl-4-acyloxetan-2-one decarboxylase
MTGLPSVDRTPFAPLYPFTSRWFELDGLRYHYLDEGPRNAPAVVMLHGNPTWSFYYRTLIPPLSRVARVIASDHLGCGLSDKPQAYAYTLEQHIRNLEALLAHLNLTQITLVLHDWGGAIGMGYATRHPDRVARFVVFNTAAFFVPALPWRIRVCRIPWLGEWLVRGLNGFARAALFFAASQRQRLTPAVRAGYLAPYNSWRTRIALHRFVADIPMEPEHPTRAVLDAIDANLGVFRQHPMLILWGADDFCFTTRTFLPEWRRRFPQADVRVIPRAGHYVVEDAHEQIVPALLDFLHNTELKTERTQ